MLEYSATIQIEAPPEAVWAVLIEGSAWPEWDPTCIRIEGTIAAGAKIKAYTHLSPGRAFPVKVSTFEPGAKMVWSGGMPLGLFRGVRTFTLEASGSGTAFRVQEQFSGPLLGMMRSSLPDMKEPFARFTAGLKARVEA